MYNRIAYSLGQGAEPPPPLGDQIDDIVRAEVVDMKDEIVDLLGSDIVQRKDLNQGNNWSLGNEPASTSRNNLLIGPVAGTSLGSGSNNVIVGNGQ
jgi:hypothetical protein